MLGPGHRCHRHHCLHMPMPKAPEALMAVILDDATTHRHTKSVLKSIEHLASLLNMPGIGSNAKYGCRRPAIAFLSARNLFFKPRTTYIAPTLMFQVNRAVDQSK